MAKIAILGAGNGGCAAAADMTLKRFEVGLFDLFPRALAAIEQQGGLNYSGAFGEGFVKLDNVSSSMERAVAGADLIMLNVPGPGHKAYAELLAPHLKPDSIVLANPGQTAGALHLVQVLMAMGVPKSVVVCETNTLSYIARLERPGKVIVSSYNKPVLVSAVPGRELSRAMKKIKVFFPDMMPVESVFTTSLSNLNAIFHPPGMILNAGWLENTKGDYRFYYDGITPAIGRVIDRLDRERLAIGRALGVELMDFPALLYSVGSTSKGAAQSGDAYIACRESEPNKFIKSPASLDDRYMHEDIMFGIGPMAYLGRLAGVQTPTIDALINLACGLMKRDYWADSVGLSAIGLDGLTIAEVRDRLYNGLL